MSIRRVLTLAVCTVALSSGTLRAQTPAVRPPPPSPDTLPRPAANPADVASVDAILKSLYDVISGRAGQKRDWNRMRSLFALNARLMPARAHPDGTADLLVWSVDDYISRAGPRLEQDGFFEREVSRNTEEFGHIMHAFSTYESRRTPELSEKPIARGINSIQLLKDGGRWWVVSIFWDSERPDNPLPAKYLPR